MNLNLKSKVDINITILKLIKEENASGQDVSWLIGFMYSLFSFSVYYV